MKIFDSELTERGTIRKVIYCTGVEFNKEARLVAQRDIVAELRINREPKIKPFKDPIYSNMEYITYLERWKIEQSKQPFSIWFKKKRENEKILAFLNS